jgi:nicotinate phosphoribosyltransferase
MVESTNEDWLTPLLTDHY